MTDDHLDELASAHLDGATSPAEAAELAATADAERRMTELRVVRARLQDVGVIDATAREAAIAAALGAAPPVAGVTSLTAVRAGRTMSRTTRAVLGAVAAIVLLALVIPVLGRRATSDRAQTASVSTTVRDAPASESGAPDASADSEATSGLPTTTATSSTPLDLGAFSTVDALLDTAEATLALRTDQGAVKHFSGMVALQCAQDLSADAAALVAIATATVADVPLIVVTWRDTAGAMTLRVFRFSDCALVAERSLSTG